MIFEAIAVGIVAIFHIWFFVLERYIWNMPVGQKIFGMSEEKAKASSLMAANQGVYNLFLGLGLILTLVFNKVSGMEQVRIFILAYIICCGFYGAYTVGRTVFLQQVLPAIAALYFVLAQLATPMLNDVSTTLDNPPIFLSELKLSSDTVFRYTDDQKKMTQRFYPQLIPARFLEGKEKVISILKDVVSHQKNWIPVTGLSNPFKLQYAVTTSGVGFTDDVVIEVRNLTGIAGVSEVHIRSKSRVGQSDFGVNARRIQNFLQSLRLAIYEQE